MKRCHFVFLLFFIVFGCIGKTDNHSFQRVTPKDFDSVLSDQIQYAQGFTLKHLDRATYIEVRDPWNKGKILARYLLSGNTVKEAILPQTDFVIVTPVNKVAALSSVYLGMFNLLQSEKKIVACSNAKLICDSILYSRFRNGDLIDLGESNEMNAEAVIGVAPDLVMKYIYGSREAAEEKVIAAGIPIAYNMEFMEPHPLGRAEWIKFVAAFIGKEQLADSIFNQIRVNYLALSQKAGKVSKRPSVLDGSSYKGVWYAAGGGSYPARLYADAGASYYWSADSSRGSVPLSFEVILDKQANADFWIGPSTGSRRELLGIESRYKLLKPFQTGNVFDFGKRKNENGGLEYFESGVVRPDILLSDLLWVFHPELVDSDYQPVYIERMKE
jgi:iron complex transport system substrate-binding protein